MVGFPSLSRLTFSTIVTGRSFVEGGSCDSGIKVSTPFSSRLSSSVFHAISHWSASVAVRACLRVRGSVKVSDVDETASAVSAGSVVQTGSEDGLYTVKSDIRQRDVLFVAGLYTW